METTTTIDTSKYVLIDRRIELDRRVSDSPTSSERRKNTKDRRRSIIDIPIISKDVLSSFIDTLKSEIQLLVDFFKDQERKKLSIINASIGTFTIFITGLVTIIFLANKFNMLLGGIQSVNNATIDGTFITIMFFVVLGGLGIINLMLIKYLASLRAGTVLSMRQLNCLRQALDCATYAQIEGHFPREINSLYDSSTIYHVAFGKHRKLPLDNTYLRKDCESIIGPADHFAIVMISLFTCGLLSAPIYYFYRVAENSIINRAISALMFIFFISFVVYIAWSGRRQILAQLKSNEHA